MRKVRSMVGELSRPGTREEGEVRECSSRDSGNLGVERLGRMNSRTRGKSIIRDYQRLDW